jgi:hypothetical protein
MQSECSGVNAVCNFNSSKRKRASGLGHCRRELAKCQEELRVMKEEKVKLRQLSNIVADTTKKNCELERQKELHDQFVGCSGSTNVKTSREYSDVLMELDRSESKLAEAGADKCLLAAELNEWKELQTSRQKLKSKAKIQVLKAFKWKKEQTDPQLLSAVSSFWESFPECRPMMTTEWRQLKRKSKKGRMMTWKYVTEYGWDGDMVVELEAGFVGKRRFSAVDIARSSDLDSNFNLKVVSDLNKCDPQHKKYARSILPSQSTCRRIQDRVHRAAVRHGLSSFPAEKEGNVWCWVMKMDGLRKVLIVTFMKRITKILINL